MRNFLASRLNPRSQVAECGAVPGLFSLDCLPIAEGVLPSPPCIFGIKLLIRQGSDVVSVGTANAYRISAMGAEHGRDCRSRCFLRDDAACPNLGRPTKKGAGLCGCGALQPARWCVGASRLFENYRLPREDHQHTPTRRRPHSTGQPIEKGAGCGSAPLGTGSLVWRSEPVAQYAHELVLRNVPRVYPRF